MRVVPITFPEMSDEDWEEINEFNRLHQQIFDLLVKVSGLPPELLQPKAHLSKHADLVEQYFYNKSMDNRRKYVVK